MKLSRFAASLLLAIFAYATAAPALAAVVPMPDCGHDHGHCLRCALWCARHGHHGDPMHSGGHQHHPAAQDNGVTGETAPGSAGMGHDAPGHDAAPKCAMAPSCGHPMMAPLTANRVAVRLTAPSSVLPGSTPGVAPAHRPAWRGASEDFPPPSPPPRPSL